ncbi:hypothetical protein N7535_000380 [Penicillium sp. DV-2018c]|nr:hypothetical protein N7461_006373 [Penicillium sp. DV-2018c]KAJ5581760.1 hypothetical protein N7535_000380 [Penicillium sp. DV-2018c]
MTSDRNPKYRQEIQQLVVLDLPVFLALGNFYGIFLVVPENLRTRHGSAGPCHVHTCAARIHLDIWEGTTRMPTICLFLDAISGRSVTSRLPSMPATPGGLTRLVPCHCRALRLCSLSESLAISFTVVSLPTFPVFC